MYLQIVLLFVLFVLGGLAELWVIYKLGRTLAERFGDKAGYYLGNVLIMLVFAPFLALFFYSLSLWGKEEVPMPGWMQPVGVVLLVTGALITWIGVRNLSSARWWSKPKFEQKPAENLVEHGIYRWIRHPTYLGQSLAIYGVAILIPMKITLLMALFLHIHFALIHSRIEEWRCVQIFGDAYREYMKRTNRFFPWNVVGRLWAR